MVVTNGMLSDVTEKYGNQQIESESGSMPKDAVVQLPLWAAKIALRIAGLGRNASHQVIIVFDEDNVRFSIDSVPFERVRVGK